MSYQILLLTKVEQNIIYYFLWRVIKGMDEWFTGGLKKLANNIGRHEKSVVKALKSLQEKSLIETKKVQKKVWIKHTLSDDELFPRLAILCDDFCSSQAINERKKDLLQLNQQLKHEKQNLREKIQKKKMEEKRIEIILENMTDADLNDLVSKILTERTYANVNSPIEDIIKVEIVSFRDKMYEKYCEFENDDELIGEVNSDELINPYVPSKEELDLIINHSKRDLKLIHK
ncbi:MAG: hypothetical protein HZR80_00380 [Candidatus Heimdallarchaeota archaeon]